MDAESSKGSFLGYGAEGEMGYKIWLLQLRKVISSCDVLFNEAKIPKRICTSLELSKKPKFQQQPIINIKITFQGYEKVEIYKTIFLLVEDGQQNREILDPGR